MKSLQREILKNNEVFPETHEKLAVLADMNTVYPKDKEFYFTNKQDGCWNLDV